MRYLDDKMRNRQYDPALKATILDCDNYKKCGNWVVTETLNPLNVYNRTGWRITETTGLCRQCSEGEPQT